MMFCEFYKYIHGIEQVGNHGLTSRSQAKVSCLITLTLIKSNHFCTDQEKVYSGGAKYPCLLTELPVPETFKAFTPKSNRCQI